MGMNWLSSEKFSEISKGSGEKALNRSFDFSKFADEYKRVVMAYLFIN